MELVLLVILLNPPISSSIHFLANSLILFFFMVEQAPLCLLTSYFLYPEKRPTSVSQRIGSFSSVGLVSSGYLMHGDRSSWDWK